MNDKFAELLEKLAVKLGTTAEHLWVVLIAQAKIYGWTQIIIGSFLFVLVLFATTVFFHLRKKLNKDYDDGRLICSLIMMFFACMFFCGQFFSTIQDIITVFNNPEYYALKEVTKMLK